MEITITNGEVVKLRELTTGDIFDAQDAAKTVQIVLRQQGKEQVGNPEFIVDYILFERLLMLRSIVSINEDEEKADIHWLRSLPPEDYQKLREAGEKVDAATAAEVGARGRDSAASG